MGRIGIDGVFQVWPSQDQGEVWYFNVFNFNGDTRLNCDGVIKGSNQDGFAVIDNPAPHVYVETSTGYTLKSLPQRISHKEIASRGYMYKVNDWEQIEITTYFNVVQADDDLTITMFARGAEFTTPMPWCPGSSYKLEIRKDGKFRFVKQQYFLQATPWSQGWVDVPDLFDPLTLNGWFGVKFAVYNKDIGGGKQGVKLEFYLDPGSTNAFLKVGEYTDSGGWGGSDTACDGATDQILTWGGPLVGYSWDSAQNLRFRLMSVRTINPGGTFGDPVPQPGKVLVASTHVYRIGIAAKQTCESIIPPDPNPPPIPPGGGLTTTVKKFAEQHDMSKFPS
jgi:hypothetical protein